MDIDVILTPADIERISKASEFTGLAVVFDVLRATSTMITALHNGVKSIIPVSTIKEALELKKNFSDALLGGERNGLRISAKISGGVDFDLGNSPREFVKEKVDGKTVVITTTNGTIAIKTAMKFESGVISSFLNLSATARYIIPSNPKKLTIICSGTRDKASLEDIIAAGALINKLNEIQTDLSDSAFVARDFYLYNKNNLANVVRRSANAKRLLSNPELSDDVGFCLQLDLFNFVAIIKDGKILKGG